MIQAIQKGDGRAASAWYGRLSVLMSQLGLTPRGRQLVPVEEDDAEDGADNPFAALVRGSR
jgi:phage terminase small subunit